jgi:probable phosphoglycerate mutase
MSAYRLLFLRHGATALNASGLRCGGDVDLPISDLGHRQVTAAAREIAQSGRRIDIIVSSGLRRTRETAEIVSRHLGGVEVVIEPRLDERRLGAWNRRPIVENQAQLAAGVTPPGGETNDEFTRRILGAAAATLLPLLPRGVLLVGSKGVARVLGELTGHVRDPLDNAEVEAFDLVALSALATRPMECMA